MNKRQKKKILKRLNDSEHLKKLFRAIYGKALEDVKFDIGFLESLPKPPEPLYFTIPIEFEKRKEEGAE